MATLVLSTVGTALAGPIGGVLGSLVGQSIDQQLLGGGARKGPRLGDLSVQTSSYGTPVPRIYGTMRVAGTIVWATDLKEDSELQGDGKSQPETVVYTYSASFAVALSCRSAAGIKRIWADGTLIRGMAGDMKVPGKFRFYPGSEGQPVDPLIASIEGLSQSPAYRGLALAVFEDLQLGSFGNRIPALTFELQADESMTIGGLLGDASGGAILCGDEREIAGYAAHGDDIASAIAPLIEAFAVELHDFDEILRSPAPSLARNPAPEDYGASGDIGGAPLLERELAPATSIPSALAMTYYDPARDYQAGQVRVSSPSPGRVTRTLSLPCVLEAGAAKSVAESLLLRAWALRERVTVRLPLGHLDVQPGDLFRLPELPGQWLAEEVEIAGFVVAVVLRPVWAHAGSRSADPGRGNPQPDVVAAPTRMVLFDLPDPETSQPTLALAAASPSGGWSPVPVEIQTGGTGTASRTAAQQAVIGSVAGALGAGPTALFDMANGLDVQLANQEQWLQSRDDDALAMGANLAAVGDEIIQFGSAEPIAPGRFRLSKLLRGRRGSEWAVAGHVEGEDFVLLDARALKAIPLPVEMTGSLITVTAHGAGDMDSPASVSRPANGEAMRPLSPAHLSARRDADGSQSLRWVRRSRLAWGWQDEIEAPADPGVQGYRIKITGSAGSIERDVTECEAAFDASELAALGAGIAAVEVRQVGSTALSRPAAIHFNL
jgi:hypothetical protein